MHWKYLQVSKSFWMHWGHFQIPPKTKLPCSCSNVFRQTVTLLCGRSRTAIFASARWKFAILAKAFCACFFGHGSLHWMQLLWLPSTVVFILAFHISANFTSGASCHCARRMCTIQAIDCPIFVFYVMNRTVSKFRKRLLVTTHFAN